MAEIKLKYDTLILYSDHYTKYPGDIKGDEAYTPTIFRGNQTTISGGLNFGF